MFVLVCVYCRFHRLSNNLEKFVKILTFPLYDHRELSIGDKFLGSSFDNNISFYFYPTMRDNEQLARLTTI